MNAVINIVPDITVEKIKYLILLLSSNFDLVNLSRIKLTPAIISMNKIILSLSI